MSLPPSLHYNLWEDTKTDWSNSKVHHSPVQSPVSSRSNFALLGGRLMSSMTQLMTDNVLTLLVGTGAVVSMVVIAAILLLKRRSKTEVKLERRKTSHVTEVLQVGNSNSRHWADIDLSLLQVDMVDRRIRSTSLDHSLDIEEMMPSPSAESRADAVLRPIAGLSVTRIEWTGICQLPQCSLAVNFSNCLR